MTFTKDKFSFKTEKGLKLDRKENGEVKYTDWPQDELSLVYYVRHLDLKPGATFTVNSCVDNELQPAALKVVKKVTMKTMHGKKEVFYITSTLGDAKFHIGADAARIPYLFEIKLNFGWMKAVLKEYSPEQK